MSQSRKFTKMPIVSLKKPMHEMVELLWTWLFWVAVIRCFVLPLYFHLPLLIVIIKVVLNEWQHYYEFPLHSSNTLGVITTLNGSAFTKIIVYVSIKKQSVFLRKPFHLTLMELKHIISYMVCIYIYIYRRNIELEDSLVHVWAVQVQFFSKGNEVGGQKISKTFQTLNCLSHSLSVISLTSESLEGMVLQWGPNGVSLYSSPPNLLINFTNAHPLYPHEGINLESAWVSFKVKMGIFEDINIVLFGSGIPCRLQEMFNMKLVAFHSSPFSFLFCDKSSFLLLLKNINFTGQPPSKKVSKALSTFTCKKFLLGSGLVSFLYSILRILN